MIYYILAGLSLFVVEMLYFRLADKFNIIDKPNHRSSHTSITIRGGGVIFSIAALGWFAFTQFTYPYFIVGLLAISLISFLDDLLTLNNKLRLSVHLAAVMLLFTQWEIFGLNWYWLVIALIFVLATINAYNFMDGINGITGSYSLLAIVTLYYINERIVNFTSGNLLITVGLSLIVFNFFNFRKKAKCFAGDVGSVGIAFIIVFLIGQLMIKTNDLSYVLLLLVYGVDTAFTVLFRKLRGEHIFEAHRSHFYQYLANQMKIPHLIVAGIYFIAQLLISTLLIILIDEHLFYTLLIVLIYVGCYLMLRLKFEGKALLLTHYEV